MMKNACISISKVYENLRKMRDKMWDLRWYEMRWTSPRSLSSWEKIYGNTNLYTHTRIHTRVKCVSNEDAVAFFIKCGYCGVTRGSRTSRIRAGRGTPTSSQSPRRSIQIREYRYTNALTTGNNISPHPEGILNGTSQVSLQKHYTIPYS